MKRGSLSLLFRSSFFITSERGSLAADPRVPRDGGAVKAKRIESAAVQPRESKKREKKRISRYPLFVGRSTSVASASYLFGKLRNRSYPVAARYGSLRARRVSSSSHAVHARVLPVCTKELVVFLVIFVFSFSSLGDHRCR